jgi:hypothetical protein
MSEKERMLRENLARLFVCSDGKDMRPRGLELVT